MKAIIITIYALLSLALGSATNLDGVDNVDVVSVFENDSGIAHDGNDRALASNPTRIPTRRRTAALATRLPTMGPIFTPCAITDKTVYECGEPITVDLDYSRRLLSEAARIDDRIAIYPCYITDFKTAEVWQWGCGAPPLIPKTCAAPRSKGKVVFNALPRYNLDGQAWPLAPNYNSQRKEVNRCFRVVVLRNDEEPYTRYCMSNTFKVYENTKEDCKKRLTSPTDDF